MGEAALSFSAAMNLHEILVALDYGRKHLDSETFQKVEKTFFTLVKHILLWILIAALAAGALVGASRYVSNEKEAELLNEYGATQWQGGVRVDSTTVQYTKGESYRFDVTELGLNLDTDFPNQRSLTLLLNDENELKGVISDDDLEKVTNIFAYGLVAGLILAVVIMVSYAVYIRKHALYAKKWYSFMQWTHNPEDESLLDIFREE